MGSNFLLQEVQIREALPQLADELGNVATLFKRRLDHDASGGIVKHLVKDIVAQLINRAVLRAINFEDAEVGSLALALFVVFARMIKA